MNNHNELYKPMTKKEEMTKNTFFPELFSQNLS
jgi:hypothetical protein